MHAHASARLGHEIRAQQGSAMQFHLFINARDFAHESVNGPLRYSVAIYNKKTNDTNNDRTQRPVNQKTNIRRLYVNVTGALSHNLAIYSNKYISIKS